MSQAPHDGRRLSGANRDALVDALAHLEQLQAMTGERGHLDRAHFIGRIAKDYRAELGRRQA